MSSKGSLLEVEEATFRFAVERGSFAGVQLRKGQEVLTGSRFRLKLGNVFLEGALNLITIANEPFVRINIRDGQLHRITLRDLKGLGVPVKSIQFELIRALELVLSVHDPRIAVDLVEEAGGAFVWKIALAKKPASTLSAQERGSLFKGNQRSTQTGQLISTYEQYPFGTILQFNKQVSAVTASSDPDAVNRRDTFDKNMRLITTYAARFLVEAPQSAQLFLVDVSPEFRIGNATRVLYVTTQSGISKEAKCAAAEPLQESTQLLDECLQTTVKILPQGRNWFTDTNVAAIISQMKMEIWTVPVLLSREETVAVLQLLRELINLLSEGAYTAKLTVDDCGDKNTFRCLTLTNFKGPRGLSEVEQRALVELRDRDKVGFTTVRFQKPLWEGVRSPVTIPEVDARRKEETVEGVFPRRPRFDAIKLGKPPTTAMYLRQLEKLLVTKTMEHQPLENIYQFVKEMLENIGETDEPFDREKLVRIRNLFKNQIGFEVSKARTQLAIFMAANEVNLDLSEPYSNSRVNIDPGLITRIMFFADRLFKESPDTREQDAFTIVDWLCRAVYRTVPQLPMAPGALCRARRDLTEIARFTLRSHSHEEDDAPEEAEEPAQPQEEQEGIWSRMLTGIFNLHPHVLAMRMTPHGFIANDVDDEEDGGGRARRPPEPTTAFGRFAAGFVPIPPDPQTQALQRFQREQEEQRRRRAEEDVRGEFLIAFILKLMRGQSGVHQQTMEQRENLGLLCIARG